MTSFANIPLLQLLALWRAAASAPSGAARNAIFWELVEAIEASGFVGDARRVLERAAPWAR